MDTNLNWSTKINTLEKGNLVIKLYWQSDPLKIKSDKIKGEPILNLNLGLFKAANNEINPKNLVSTKPDNIITIDEENKFYTKEENIDFLAYYILAKN